MNSLTGPDPEYGEILGLFRRNDLSRLSEATPAMLLGFSFLIYRLGFGDVFWFAWCRHEPASGMPR